MRILTVVGARPQFIKAATVSRVLRHTEGVQEVLVHTGQHYDANMSGLFFQELDIPEPNYNLGIGSAQHGEQTGRMLQAIEDTIIHEKPDCVLVYGDTNSTLAGALAAAKLNVPVAHVEAGLRSFNRRMPEEINRILTDHAADLLFAPTRTAIENLMREGFVRSAVIATGDVMYDAALFYAGKSERESRILGSLELQPSGYVLATLHRAENTDDPARLEFAFRALVRISETFPVVFPAHPRTRAALNSLGRNQAQHSAIRMIDPVGYLDMVKLEKNARVIVTDSGGVQKEAYFYRVPCVTLREETEWGELLESGWNRLAPPALGPVAIANAVIQADGTRDLPHAEIYGDGHAAEKVVSEIWTRCRAVSASGS